MQLIEFYRFCKDGGSEPFIAAPLPCLALKDFLRCGSVSSVLTEKLFPTL